MSTRQLCTATALTLLVGAGAGAHPLAPSLLELELEDSRARVTLKTPLKQPSGGPVEPILPEDCTPVGPVHRSVEGTGAILRFELDCGSTEVVGRSVGLARLAETGTTGLVRVTIDGVPVVRQVVNAARPTVVVHAQPSALDTARAYLMLGAEHIAFGFDHLLFVAGLLLLIHGGRALVTTITAFTIGHSMTLALAVLERVSAPGRWIEVAIAASLVWLAAEALALRTRGPRGAWRRPELVAAGFGLLHGFGFAGALLDAGLPQGDIPLALAAFNLGIELGQLTFVAGALLLVAGLERLHAWPRAAPTAVAYAIGTLGIYWVLQRALPA